MRVRLATCYRQWCSRCWFKQTDDANCYLNCWEGLWEEQCVFRLMSSLPLLYLKASLFFVFSDLMSKHYTVPKETEGINFWLNCCVFRATDIPLSYLAGREGGNCAASPCFQLLRSQMVRKQYCQRKERGNMGKSRKCNFEKSSLNLSAILTPGKPWPASGNLNLPQF